MRDEGSIAISVLELGIQMSGQRDLLPFSEKKGT